METIYGVLLFLCFYLKSSCDGARLQPQESTSTEFIRASCSVTAYPALCFSSLSSYASTIQSSPLQLARTSLSVSLDGARAASADIKRMSARGGAMSRREAAAMSDCMGNVGDSVDELRESVGEMGRLRGKDMGFQLNSVQTWVSAALTDDDTCMDEFAGNAMNGGVKTVVRGRVVRVAQLTSNSLALLNGLASSSHSSSP